MARVELAPEVGADLERILEHLARHEVADAPARIREIIDGISVLEHHPLMGRPALEDLCDVGIRVLAATCLPPTGLKASVPFSAYD